MNKVIGFDSETYDDLEAPFLAEMSKEHKVAAESVEAIYKTERQIKLKNIYEDYENVYAGVWLDEDYVPHISFTQLNKEVEEIAENYGVIVVKHDFSEKELLNAFDNLSTIIHNNISLDDSSSFIYNQISYITELNRIEVELHNTSYQRSMNNITKMLSNKNFASLFDYLVFEETTVKADYEELVAVKGGTKIDVSTSGCSAGYRANFGGKAGFVTAAHCGYQGANVYKGLLTKVGTVKRYSYSASMDAAWVELSGSHTAPNQTYNNRTYGSTGSSSSMGFMPGVPLTMYGLDGNDSCVLKATSVTFAGHTNLARSDCRNRKVAEGWSGGIVLNSRTVGVSFVWNANGIIVARNANAPESVYTRKSDSIKSALGIDR